MNFNRLIIFILVLAAFLQSCSIEKRRYNKGFHVERIFSFPVHAKNENIEIPVITAEKIQHKNIIQLNPLAEKTVVVPVHQDLPVANEPAPPKNEAVSTSKKTWVKPPVPAGFPDHQQITKTKKQVSALSKKQPSGFWVGMLILGFLLLAATYPPVVLHVSSEKFWFHFLANLAWVLGVLCILFFLQPVWLIILSLMAWNFVNLLFYALHADF